MSIQSIGIIGAGTMGNGIAQTCAISGLTVVMVDIAQAALDKGLATIDKSLERLLSKDKISAADKQAALGPHHHVHPLRGFRQLRSGDRSRHRKSRTENQDPAAG